MRKSLRKSLTKVGAGAMGAALLFGGLPNARIAQASSHREAPLLLNDQKADNTDVYAFVSPDRPGSVTLIANYIPFEEPSGGPDFYRFDDNVLYQIRIDNDADARVDLAFQFRFRTTITNPDTFIYNTGPITSLTDPDWIVRQNYDVNVQVRQADGTTFQNFVLGQNLPTPPVNIGPRSTPNYETALA